MQVKVKSHKGSDTANDSPLGVPDELGQETLRETAEALVHGQTASKTTEDYMRQTVETVASQQSPVNLGQQPKRMIFTTSPEYPPLGATKQGTGDITESRRFVSST